MANESSEILSSGSEDEEDVPEADTFKILLSSDNHLGYNEDDNIRGNDSFNAFEEALMHAKSHDVDFVLLGGDLFHVNKPSSFCIQKCLELIKKYCLGNKHTEFYYLSQNQEDFRRSNCVNYMDPNLNVAYPIFTIHGNHDDPVDVKQTSALDIIATAGFVNYFGHWSNLKEINVKPILLCKGNTKLALYGLSHVHDQRLARLLIDGKVNFCQPEGDDWFHLLVLHQNRANRGSKNFIETRKLPKFIDLVIWGHEHDCCIASGYEAAHEDPAGFYICQPGSTVATSLTHGESQKKHVALLKIAKQRFIIEPIPLVTVRPFIFSEFDLTEEDDTTDTSSRVLFDRDNPNVKRQIIAQNRVTKKIEELIRKANDEYNGPVDPPPLPLIRVRVCYEADADVFNTIRFGQQFVGRVANPDDIVKMNRVRETTRQRRGHSSAHVDGLPDHSELNANDNIPDLIDEYFEKPEHKYSMKLLAPDVMTETLRYFVDADDQAFSRSIAAQCEEIVNKLISQKVADENITAVIEELRDTRYLSSIKQKIMDKVQSKDPISYDDAFNTNINYADIGSSDDSHVVEIDGDDNLNTTALPVQVVKRGRGSRGGRGGTPGAGRRARRSKI